MNFLFIYVAMLYVPNYLIHIAICSGSSYFQNLENSEVKNVYNITVVQKAITKSSVRQHGPPTNAKVGSGA
jgi:hypothetical protein